MKHLFKIGAATVIVAALSACGGSGGGSSRDSRSTPVAEAEFEVRVSNLTHAQPMSPVAVMMHATGFNSFTDGVTASLALEFMAEGGDNTDVIGEARAAVQHLASASTVGPVPPSSISPVVALTVPGENLADLRLTVLSMLVLTNDAFSGVNAADISNMAVGESLRLTGFTWDAGTEGNVETAATIPAMAGEGFNPARDDIFDRVRFHQGVVTNASSDFGLASSALTEAHRFLNPSSRIVVTRIR